MTAPQVGWPTVAKTDACQGQRDSEWGSELLYMPHDQKSTDSPTSYQVTLGMQRNIARLLGPCVQGLCIKKDDDGLKVGVYGIGKYMIGSTAYTLPGTYPVTLSASQTTYLWCDEDEVVETSTTAWPGTDHFKIAIVTTNATEVTNIIDCRMMNFGIGAITNWWTIQPQAAVDMNNKRLDNLNNLRFQAWSNLTISSGAVTPTQTLHTISPETPTTDELDTIAADAGQVGRLLLLRRNSGTDTITVTENGNIYLNGEECVLTGASDYDCIGLMQVDASSWMELFRTESAITTLLNSVQCAGHSLVGLGQLNCGIANATISSGSFSLTLSGLDRSFIRVETEGLAATDDLESVTDGASGDLLVLMPKDDAHTVVVKHGVGAGLFKLANGLDFEMNTLDHTLACRHNGTQWVELFRSPMRMESLVSDLDNDAGDKISRCIPYPLGPIYLSGALTAQVYEQNIYVPRGMTIKNATGIVDQAPSGGSCIIDVQVNGGSIFASDAERIKIDAAQTQDTSATKNYEVVAGDIITLEVLSTGGSPNGADDAVIVLNCFCAPQTAPQA